LQVLVRDNNVEQAMKALKRKLQREGVFREMKLRKAYEKPSERRVREAAEAVRRARKLARKQAQREGLLPAPSRRCLWRPAQSVRHPASEFSDQLNEGRPERCCATGLFHVR